MLLIDLVGVEAESILRFWVAVRHAEIKGTWGSKTHRISADSCIHTFIVSHSQADCQYLDNRLDYVYQV